jgi:hypothetical protein
LEVLAGRDTRHNTPPAQNPVTHFTASLTCEFNAAVDAPAKSKRTKQSDVSPLVIRVTAEEREWLRIFAVGMTLSAYVRACVFGHEAKQRKRRAKKTVADKKAVAEALALLGQSRIANNLNQFAYCPG